MSAHLATVSFKDTVCKSASCEIPLRIAHFESSMNWGGQELRIVEQTEWLNAHGYPTWIIARPGSQILEQAAKRGLPWFELPMRGSLHPKTLSMLLHFLKREHIQLLDCHGGRDSVYGACVKFLSKVAVVRSRHVTDPIRGKGWRGWVWRHGNHGILTTAAKIGDMLLAQQLARTEDITVAPAGVDPDRFHPDRERAALKAQLGIPEHHTVIANVGMIRPDKGQRYFVEMARQLLAAGHALTFIQVGEATAQTQAYREEVLQAAGDALGREILFLGYHDDIENYLALADIVVVASIDTEAQTRLVAQAALMRRNLVVTRVGGLPEMIDDGVTGLLCPPGNASALATAVGTLLQSPPLASRLQEAAYQRAWREMTFDHMMQVMLDAYQRAMVRAGVVKMSTATHPTKSAVEKSQA